jgi:hypothetical protein
MSAPHVHRARAIKAYFEAAQHFVARRPALAKAKLAEAKAEQEQYEQARRARAEGRRFAS